jgi:hypothetical protein
VVPHRRVVELARYGMAGSAHQLNRHGDSRKLATLLATVVYLECKASRGRVLLCHPRGLSPAGNFVVLSVKAKLIWA